MMFAGLIRIIAAFCALLVASAGVAQPQREPGPLVLAAASLRESMTAAADVWARAGHARPVVSFAASSALARQVEAGARADLFVSADEDWMNVLAAKRLIAANTRAVLAGNRLVIVAPAARARPLNLGNREAAARALSAGPLAMADPASVPAGRYGRAAFERLGLWRAVASRVVRAENVRAALALVERGAAPFGVVYATDARASSRVRVVARFPAASHPAIIYPVARLTASRHPEAEGFRRFLLSPRGKGIFARYGFIAR